LVVIGSLCSSAILRGSLVYGYFYNYIWSCDSCIRQWQNKLRLIYITDYTLLNTKIPIICFVP